MGNLKSRRPGRMLWPASYTAGNSRRVALLRKQREGLTSNEELELGALEAMVEAWVESRYPSPRIEYALPVVREVPAVYGESYIRPEFTLETD